MTTTAPIRVTRTAHSQLSQIDFANLGFGNYISDHMFVADYKNGAWETGEVVPFGPLPMTPAILSLHYGQAVFEGMKAFRMNNGSINIFRPQRHSQRLNQSLARMCMPPIDEEFFIEALKAVIRTDEKWIPSSEGSALYIRPVVFASESRLGVKISDEYKFVVLTSPVGPYFTKPVRVKVEETYVRAAEGGTGFAKCAGNYGGAFYPTQLARQQGFDQVLWTDAKEHKYIDESGAMNVMFVLNGKLVTPKLTSSLLDGVTRDSILTLSESLGIQKEERKVSIAELEEGFKNGTLTEAFGVGTAAVVSTIAVIHIHGTDYALPADQAASFQQRVKQKLHHLRVGNEADTHGWNYII
ncbi:MAG: branched-chain amino acid aminotransferase [Cyclobacteriaceae bacterium]|jgi:branched-chain amino acid aminotransferase|nr:branched-chain amino acid aminotransferase [Cyclobacteriaceae bacterium]